MMEYSPNLFFSEGMQDSAIQASAAAASSLPYANMVAMDEQEPGYSAHHPLQANLAVAIPYNNVGHFNMAHEELGFNVYATMHNAGSDDLSQMENCEPHSHLYINAEPNISTCNMTPGSLPLWPSHAEEPLNILQVNPHYALDDQVSDHYLLALQSLLKSQYGISLTLDQLLAFDALPALLQPENEQPQSHDLDLKHKLPVNAHHGYAQQGGSLAHINIHQDVQVNQVAETAYQFSALSGNANQDGISACVSPVSNKRLCVNEPYRAQDISSPGSAASSSVVTDSESCHMIEKPLQRHAAECIGASITNLSQYWITQSISWAPAGAGGDESTVLQALQAMEVMVPAAAQRGKLQGITLEQVLQAEKMQQITVASHKNPAEPSAVIAAPACTKSLLLQDKNVVAKSATEDIDTRAGSTIFAAGQSNLGPVRDQVSRAEAMSPFNTPVQPKTPGATSVEPQSIAARHRRKRIREKTESLGMIIPGATRLDTAAMFDLAIKYVHFLQAQMFCLENEVSFISSTTTAGASRQSMRRPIQRSANNIYEEESSSVSGFRRALIHRLLCSQDVQHFLAREGLCLVTQSLASKLNFDPVNSVQRLSMKAPAAAAPARPPPTAAADLH